MITQSKIPSITAMDLRKTPGRYLDRVELRHETFIVERAGKAKAAIVPLSELEQLERIRTEARQEVLVTNTTMQRSFAASGLTEEELDALTEEAIEAVRGQNNKS